MIHDLSDRKHVEEALQESERVRRGVPGYVANLKADLAITEDQLRAWAKFAATLSGNGRRVQRADDEDQPFGHLEDRLAALASMRQAGRELFPVLRADQHSLKESPSLLLARTDGSQQRIIP